jgi:type VI secretion system protein ImpL
MSSLFGFLRSRVFWVSVGVIVLCLLIWMFGDMLAFGDMRPLETPFARIFLIGLILVYFLIRLLIMRWRAGRMNERIANMLRTSLSTDSEAVDKGQTAILKDRFAEALNILRKTRFETGQPSFWGRIMRRGRYVYELPWYVIIGAPGVGKTTALLNSGLSFPLSGQIGAGAIRGAGGTRNCDWWFTNEAVFIDTAGRYTTHETDAQVDKAEWRGFLSLLKKNRSRQPINGVLLMLSVAELLGQNREECQKHAATLRQRLDELRGDLGMSFPVYLLINKCDLMLGFDEYFSTLDRSGRAQVWGSTLPLDPSGKYRFDLGNLGRECDLLQTRINAGLVDVLQAEPDLSRRELIFAFPQQFAALTQVLKGMLSDLLEGSHFSESPFLRGIYFTSATQEGTPFDRVVHSLGQGFQIQRPQKVAVAGEGKAYFLHELLSKVVFGEAHIAGRDRRAERRSHIWHAGGYALSVLALAGTTLAWATSRYNNQKYLDEVDIKVDRMKETLSSLPLTANTDVMELLPVLNRAENLLNTDSVQVDDPPLWWQFGLFQGSSLKPKVRGDRGIYRRLLSGRLVPAIEASLERRLRGGVDAGDMEESYDALKAYLMLHDQDRLTEKGFVESVNITLTSGFTTGQRTSLARHVKASIGMNALAASREKDGEYEQLVRKAREQLNRLTSAERVYRRVKRRPEFEELSNFTLTSALDGQPEWPLIFKRGEPTQYIAAFYTVNGYELFKKERDRVVSLVEKDESWVLGKVRDTEMSATELKRLATELYVTEYILNWQDYINNVGAFTPKSLEDAVQVVSRLSMENSPLFLFLKAAVRETELVKEPERKPNDELTTSIGNRIRQRIDSAAGVSGAGGAVADLLLSREDAPAMKVNKHFEQLRKFVNGSGGGGGGDSPILQEIRRLNAVKDALERAIYAKNNGQPMPDTSVLASLKNLPPGVMPESFKDVLKSVADASDKIIQIERTNAGTRRLQDDVTAFCMKTIAGRYPFSSGATASVAKNDFTDMFAPGGKMDRFRQEHYSGTARPPVEFNHARTIADTFFRGNQLDISFTIKPLLMDGSITNLNLSIAGNQVRYAHGPSVPMTINWPGSGGGDVRLALLPPVDNGVNDVSETGLWALHRLFDKYGQMQRGSSPDVFNVVLTVGGRRATFEIRPASTNNPFNLPELKSFRCPQRVQ